MGDYDPFAIEQEPAAVAAVPEEKVEVGSAKRIPRVSKVVFAALTDAFEHYVYERQPWNKVPDPRPDLSWYFPTAPLDNWPHDGLKIETGEGITYATMNRPGEDNKLSDSMITALADCCFNLQYRKDMRVVVLSGAGAMFCGGGDHLKDNAASFKKSIEQNEGVKRSVDAIISRARAAGAFPDGHTKVGSMLKMKLFHTWSVLPQFTFALVNGSAVDDGVGLACMCDLVIAVKSAYFSLTEVKRGFSHTLIAPYLVSKLGLGTAKRLVASSSLLSAEKAKLAGMVNELVESVQEGHALIKDLCEVITACGPRSVEAAKQLVMGVGGKPITEFVMFYTGKMLAMVTVSDEARDGMACLQARKPKPWEEKPIKPLYG
mmetsp:Transcript_51369/g.112599  ORF Transcript_51369/g.112599 Transcript_51369/m.112599 type:complete len:375 (-) Transcript_51369:134-1258(-)